MADLISDKLVRGLQKPPMGNRIVYSVDTKGFGVCVTAAGAKSFVLNYHLAGRERRMTIGHYPTWSVVAAREEAKRLKRIVDGGGDPLALRQETRQAPTVRDLWTDYKSKHLGTLSQRGQDDVSGMWRTYILPQLGNKKIKALTSLDVDDLHRTVSAHGPIRANRVAAWFRAALNLAIRWGWIDKNPATGFRRNPEQPRELFLTETQIGDVLTCLERMPNKKAANIIRLLLLTGARLGELRRAEWSQFDLDIGVWTKPSSHTKQKRSHRVPLSPEACRLLSGMKGGADCIYLFPNAAGEPVADINPSWRWLRKEIDMPRLRLHDLRHSYASQLISSGESLPVIGRLLGHTQAGTTLRYAHLLDDPLRRATNKMGAITKLGR